MKLTKIVSANGDVVYFNQSLISTISFSKTYDGKYCIDVELIPPSSRRLFYFDTKEQADSAFTAEVQP